MKDVTVAATADGTSIVLGADGTGALRLAVTSAATERVVLAAFGPAAGAAAPGGALRTTVDRPLRQLAGGLAEEYVVTFDGSGATPGSTHTVRCVAYPSDDAAEEYNERALTVTVEVPRPVPVARTRRVPWVLIAAGAAVLLAIGGTAMYLTRDQGVAVPALVGRDAGEAAAAAASAGLRAEPTSALGRRPFGVVLGQRPVPGATASRGATVTLTVSTGLLLANFTERPYPEVVAELTQRGMTVRVLGRPDGSHVNGVVVAQDPPPGTTAQRGDIITLIYALPPLSTVNPGPLPTFRTFRTFPSAPSLLQTAP
jgi:hypothetical protein